MPRRFQFNLKFPFMATAATGLLLAVLMLPDDARRAYVQWFVIPVLVLPPLGLLLLLPGYWFRPQDRPEPTRAIAARRA